MTWQRIDESTYIDDTLVTCGEYQLFIDEMREQEKYYQPDHWKSYRFPKGHARELILGVRCSDVVAFCEWLTIRVASDWRYRLPTKADITNFPINPVVQGLLGCWIVGPSKDVQFSWIGDVPVNPRSIRFESNLDVNLATKRKIAQAISRASALDLEQNVKLSYSLDDYFGFNKNFYNYGAPVPSEFRDQALFPFVSKITNRRYSPHTYDLNRAVHNALNFAREPARNSIITMGIDVYIDLFTLQERIAGRSPAFEGIRLVKERIR